MPRFLGHKAKQLISSANDSQRLTALEAGKCSKCGLLQNMSLFFKVMEQNNPYKVGWQFPAFLLFYDNRYVE